MNKIVANAFRENKDILVSSIMDELVENTSEFISRNKKNITASLRGELTEDVMKQIDVILREQEERDEARFRRLDETIRQLQSAKSEVAATRSKKGIFRR
jgi:sugar-specific transcriptional regulator TrmB